MSQSELIKYLFIYIYYINIIYICNFFDIYQVKEVIELRKADPKLWTVNALSHMLKVKPLAVMYVNFIRSDFLCLMFYIILYT